MGKDGEGGGSVGPPSYSLAPQNYFPGAGASPINCYFCTTTVNLIMFLVWEFQRQLGKFWLRTSTREFEKRRVKALRTVSALCHLRMCPWRHTLTCLRKRYDAPRQWPRACRRMWTHFAICRRPSVRLSVCLSVVCNVRAIWYLGHLWPFGKNFTEIVPGEPLRRVLYQRGVEKCSDFGPFQGYISETVQDSRIWTFDWYQTRWPWMTLNGVGLTAA